MAESKCTVDLEKLKYLGKGVDGRTPPETWLTALDKYSADNIRDLNEQHLNIDVKKVENTTTKRDVDTVRTDWNVEAHFGITPHPTVPVQLEGDLTAKRTMKKMTNFSLVRKTTRVATMLDDTSNDPNIITRACKPPTHYTKFECQLSQFVLEYIAKEQEEADWLSSHEATDSTGRDLGKKIKDLKGEDVVAKLDDYFNDVRKRKAKKSRQRLWQMVGNACTEYLNEKRHTHYVSNIVLGALSYKTKTKQDSSTELSGGGQISAGERVRLHQGGGVSTVANGETESTTDIGKMDDKGNVVREEIIEVNLKPVTQLINKHSRELKTLMTAHLKLHNQIVHGQGKICMCCTALTRPN